MTIAADRGTRIDRPPLATVPVFSAIAFLVVLLTATSQWYGYHRDELYFLMLRPAWGYVDQPPLTPLIARLFHGIAGEPWALRIPATICAAVALFVLVQLTREFGGGRRPQVLSAWGYVTAAFPLVMEHIFLTSTIDLVVWPAVCLFVARALLREEPRWWLAVGVLVGLSMYNKLLIAMLLAGIVIGLLAVGPRRVLLSRHVLAGAAIALLIGLPNLIYQATNGWPQVAMGRALADANAAEVRVLMWPFLILLVGPPLTAVWITGVVALFRRPQWRPARALAVALPVVVLLTFAAGSQFYYPLGLVLALFAVGCVPVGEWLVNRTRQIWAVVLVAVNGVVSALIALPLVPVGVVGNTPIPGINQTAGDTVGWPTYVDQIATAFAATDRDRTVVIAGNYGEAGAVARFGPDVGIPAVYSGHNELWYAAAPPDPATDALLVGVGSAAEGLFQSCRQVGELDNLVGVDNEEQGNRVVYCVGRTDSWEALWPAFRHLD